jgi:predicted nucleic acid-binding protein
MCLELLVKLSQLNSSQLRFGRFAMTWMQEPRQARKFSSLLEILERDAHEGDVAARCMSRLRQSTADARRKIAAGNARPRIAPSRIALHCIASHCIALQRIAAHCIAVAAAVGISIHCGVSWVRKKLVTDQTHGHPCHGATPVSVVLPDA